MTRRRRTEIIAKASPEFGHGLARQILENYRVTTIQEPQPVLVMIKQLETGRNSRFYLGELLVMEAKVAIGNSLGLGLFQGDDEAQAQARALDAAIIDAAWNAGLPECAAWLPQLEDQASLIAAAEAVEAGRIMKSGVSFQTMDL